MTLKHHTKLTVLALLFVASVSCKKTNSPFGKEVYDPDLLLDAQGVDTFTLVAYSELIDATFTRNARFSLLGAYRDPVFGEVIGSFFVQLRLSANNPNFGDLSTITVDSVVLAMEFRDKYGIGTAPQNFAVYRLNESLSADSNYTSNSSTSFIGQQLIEEGFSTLTPNVLQRPVVGGDTLLPQLRLRLKPSFGMELLNSAAEGHMVDNTSFLSWFKGLHVRTEDANISPSGAVFSLDLIDSDSKLTIYYTQNNEKRFFDLVINNNSVYYNRILFNYSGFRLGDLLQNTQLGKEAFYAQTANVRAVVRFPGVMNLSSKTVIHRAMLYLPYAHFNGDDRYPSPALVATNRRAPGDAVWGLTLQGGTLIPTLHPIIPQFRRYNIDVTSFVQGLIKQQPSYSIPEILISGSRTNDNVERIIFNGTESSNKFKPKLVITYTEF
jgi:hypothetical protein